jgi:hypothetical protein
MASTWEPAASSPHEPVPPSVVHRRPLVPPPLGRISVRSATSKTTRVVATAATAVTCAGLAAYLYFVDPNVPSNPYPQCPLKQLTGIDCPGCGGLRATHSLVHGDIAGAIDHNVLALVVVPLVAYLIVRWVASLWGKDLPELRLPAWSRWVIPVGVIAFTVLRNIPGPFYYFNSATA